MASDYRPLNRFSSSYEPNDLPEDEKCINVLALVKGDERYVFVYDDSSRVETLRVIGKYASNPDLSFNWYDAAVMSQKIRQTSDASKRR